MTTLRYNFVTVDEEYEIDDEDTILLIGFADAQFNTTAYLMFQYTEDPDTEGHELHIERDAQRHGIYGNVERLELWRDRVLFCFDEPTALALGTEQEVEALFPANETKAEQLRKGFQRMLGSTKLQIHF